MKPIFKRREIVINTPEVKIDLGSGKKDIEATVLYTGEKQEFYSAGDTVLYRHTTSFDDKIIKFFEQDMLVLESEGYVICKIEK